MELGISSAKNYAAFHQLCLRLDAHLAELQIPLFPRSTMDDGNAAGFLASAPEIQTWIIDNLSSYLLILEQTKTALGKNQWSESTFLWNHLKHFNARLPKGCAEAISDGDIIEILDTQGRQVFRSLNFFSITSYDPETVLSWPWDLLFKRGSEIQKQYSHFVMRSFTTTQDEFFPLDHIGAHRVSEVSGDMPLEGENQPVFCGPVFGSEKFPIGGIHVFRAINVKGKLKLRSLPLTESRPISESRSEY